MKRCSMAKTLRVKVLIVSFPSSAQAASKRYRLRPSEAGDVLAGRDPAGLFQADIKPCQCIACPDSSETKRKICEKKKKRKKEKKRNGNILIRTKSM